MTALYKRVSVLKTGTAIRILNQEKYFFDRNELEIICRCFSLQGYKLDKSESADKTPSTETREETIHTNHKKLSLFQKRLLFTSGKYDSIAAIPSTAGETELRYATDICKTLFNIWCMIFLASFMYFVHLIEKRRMRRAFARLEREEARKMVKYDKINLEAQAKRKKSTTQL